MAEFGLLYLLIDVKILTACRITQPKVEYFQPSAPKPPELLK